MTKAPRQPKPKTESSDFSLPKFEEEVLALWEKEKVFEQTLKRTKAGKPFVFFEGPPTANAKPGVHHVLARAYKDIIVRYQTMRGRFVDRRAGWDTHGLPVELQVEKELGFSGKPDIERYGIEQFNAKCKETVLAHTEDWVKLTRRIGFWLDFDRAYYTFSNDYIESLWWVIKEIWNRGLLVEGKKVVPHCPRCGTALSSHEVAQGYEDVTESSVYVKFKVIAASNRLGIGETVWKKGVSILSWTTTPWTLPGNVSLAVHPDLTYVLAEFEGEQYILAKDRLKLLGEKANVKQEFPGRDLVGTTYEPLFTFLDTGGKKAFYISAASFVTAAEGTGVVHTAAMYGVDDYELAQKLDLPQVHTVGEDGRFLDHVTPWKGQFVKDAEPGIVQDLKDRELLFRTEEITHTYPFCWRCGTVLLYYAKRSWFVSVTKVRDELKANNETITWVPSGVKHGRFGVWLNEAKDWAFSRERYWGTPLPIWRCDKGHTVCIGSFEELAKRLGKPLPKQFDPHRPFVDELTFRCEECKGKMRRVPEVVDVWFDSGAMPFSQWHYPFEHERKIENGEAYPADYISEAVDQTRGWFYTLLAVSTLLGKGAPYKNVVCLGHVLDEKGQKMSKSKGNVVDPWTVIDRYGADALRWYLFTVNPAGEAKLFTTDGVGEVVRKFFLILWNVSTFYKTHRSGKPHGEKSNEPHVLDQWIRLKLRLVSHFIGVRLEGFDVTGAARLLAEFVTELSTWYLRRSRARMKAGSEALETLRETLNVVSRLLAPFAPFFSEKLYAISSGKEPSVHLEPWPEEKTSPMDWPAEDKKLLDDMDAVRLAVELGHRLRRERNLKVRQPLSQCTVSAPLTPELAQLIADELNVEEVHVGKQPLTEAGWVSAEGKGVRVGLDVTISEELKMKGFIREVIRQVNDLRKAARLTVRDRIILSVETDDKAMGGVIERHANEIKEATLAVRLTTSITESVEAKKELVIDGTRLTLGIAKTNTP